MPGDHQPRRPLRLLAARRKLEAPMDGVRCGSTVRRSPQCWAGGSARLSSRERHIGPRMTTASEVTSAGTIRSGQQLQLVSMGRQTRSSS